MFNFNTIEKLIINNSNRNNLIKSISSNNNKINCCQQMMLNSSTHSCIPIIIKKNINGSILPFLKDECPNYFKSTTHLTPSSSFSSPLNLIPSSRLFTTSINNNKINSNINNDTTLLNSNNKTSNNNNNNNNKTTRLFRNPDNPFLKNSITSSTATTPTSTKIPPTCCSVENHTLLYQPSEQYQNCVKFETNKSNYVHEIIEGILPKELVSGSRMITPNDSPHCIFVNFSSAVKAYQADQYIRAWSEKNLPSLKSVLMKHSLDPLYSIKTSKIEKVFKNDNNNDFIINNNNNLTKSVISSSTSSTLSTPLPILSLENNNYFENNNRDGYHLGSEEEEIEDIKTFNLPEYPVPKLTIISNSSELNLIKSLLLEGKSIESLSSLNQSSAVISFDLEYIHENNKPDTYHFYVLSLSNGLNNIILNIDSLGGIPKIISDLFQSHYIKKVGFSHHKYSISDFENQFNLKLNNYDDLSKHPIILHSKPKTLTSIVAIFLKYKLPRLEIDRFIHSGGGNNININNNINDNGLFSEKKIQHYAQFSDSIYSVNRFLHQYSSPFYL